MEKSLNELDYIWARLADIQYDIMMSDSPQGYSKEMKTKMIPIGEELEKALDAVKNTINLLKE